MLKKIYFVTYIIILQLIIQILNVLNIVDSRTYRLTLFYFFIPTYLAIGLMKLYKYLKSTN
jgi:hypothetical protein